MPARIGSSRARCAGHMGGQDKANGKEVRGNDHRRGGGSGSGSSSSSSASPEHDNRQRSLW